MGQKDTSFNFSPKESTVVYTFPQSQEQKRSDIIPAESKLPALTTTHGDGADSIQPTSPPAPCLNAFPPNNVVRMPHTPSAEPILDGPIINAGYSWKQAQQLNYLAAKNFLELEKYRELKNIDFQFQVSLEMWKQAFHSSMARPPLASNPMDGGKASQPNMTGRVDFQALVTEFLRSLKLVRERDARHREEFFFREAPSIQHKAITSSELRQRLESFLDVRISPDFDIAQTTLDRVFRMMLSMIPTVKDSGLHQLTENEVAFANGVYNLVDGLFHPAIMEHYFVRFPMEFAFDSQVPTPIAFETLLVDMCGEDDSKMLHAYEELGALMSGVKTLKKLFVHQGVTNGGKTRLAAIFLSIIGGENFLAVGTLSDITDDFIAKNAGKYRVVFIEELPDKRITVNQATILKSFTSGTMLQHSPEFKILMSTNHRISTGIDGTLSPAMKSRIATLPFAKEMDESTPYFWDFEDAYFVQEIPGIARKAMEAFSRVVRNGKRFTHDFPVNDVVEIPSVPNELTHAEQKRIDDILAQPPVPPPKDRLSEVLNCLFELTSAVNPDMPGELVLKLLNEAIPGIVTDLPSLGKRLKKHFDAKLLDKRVDKKTCYNLRLRTPATPSSQE